MRTLAGMLWLGLGLGFLCFPGILRFWLRWRTRAKIRWTLFWLGLGAWFSLAWAVVGLPWWLAVALLAGGTLAIVKAFFVLKRQGAAWAGGMLAELSPEAFRWIALAYLAIGLALIFL